MIVDHVPAKVVYAYDLDHSGIQAQNIDVVKLNATP